MSKYEKLDDRQLMNELGRVLAQISCAKKVGNTFMADKGMQTRNMILREASSRGIIEEAKRREICG